jgi:hypothetical protein
MVDEGNTDEVRLEAPAAIRRRPPRALWGVLAVLALVGGALAVFAGGDGSDDAPAALPIALGAAGAEVASDAGMAADTSMRAAITYVAGGDLPTLGGEASAYRVVGAVDEQQVRALAETLGLTGDLEHLDGSPEGGPAGFWHLETDDGTLEVYEGMGASWWFTSGAVSTLPADGGGAGGSTGSASASRCEGEGCVLTDQGPTTTHPAMSCRTYEDADGGTVEECIEAGPPPPADLPSEDEARAIALDLLAGTGMDVDGATVTVEGPFDAWYVMVEPVLDGLPLSGLFATVGVGSKGEVTSASGYLGTPEALGDYPLLDTRAAIERLNDNGGYGGFAGHVGGAPAIAVDDVRSPETTAQPAAAGSSVGSGSSSSAACVADPTVTTVPGDCDDLTVCMPQPDGSTLCDDGEVLPPTTVVCDTGSVEGVEIGCAPPCPQLAPPADGEAATTTTYRPECHEVLQPPVPMPEPEPVEVILNGAEPIVVMVPANDGSADAYLVPGYRLTGGDGARVDVPAVTDGSLAGGVGGRGSAGAPHQRRSSSAAS